MSYTPVIPFSGYAGFQVLERSYELQKNLHSASPRSQNDVAYFRENIGSVDHPADLVEDYRLLRVVLGAFGLEDDIGSKAFIEKVLSEGTLAEDALANRLTDTRYRDLSKAFSFDLGTPNSKLSDFADDIVAKFETRSFEAAVGEVDADMRLALNAQRELAEIAGRSSSETTKWLTILGNEPLKQVFEQAFNLPSSFGTLDLDRQIATLRDKASDVFGSDAVSQFADADQTDALVQRFLLMRSVAETAAAYSSAQVALTLIS